jgi:hypothetical protein
MKSEETKLSDNIQGSIDGILARAQSDTDFRDLLLTNPKAAIFEATGMSVPADWNIVSSLNNAGHVELEFENGELPEDYLEMVSGGDSGGGKALPYRDGAGGKASDC